MRYLHDQFIIDNLPFVKVAFRLILKLDSTTKYSISLSQTSIGSRHYEAIVCKYMY